MMKAFIFYLAYFIPLSLFAQNIDYARKVVDTLTSEYFAGRGAVDEGEKKAAIYIRNQFRSFGLKSFDTTYFQSFHYPINTFPGELEVGFDKVQLVPGVDFLIGASSNNLKGTFKLVWYNKDNVPNKKQLTKLANRNFFGDKFIVIDDEGIEQDNESFQTLKLNTCGAAGIVLIENEKLTKHLSSTYNDFAIVKIKRGSINRAYKSITVNIAQKFISNYQSQNVIGYVKGVEYPDSFIVLSAHYDHLGKMGNTVYFPGANDNASGVGMLLNLAYHYTHKDPPKKTILFIAFGAEESGLIGSKYFVENPTIPLNKINFVFNMDLMGTGSEGAMIVNGAVFPKHFDLLQKVNVEYEHMVVLKKRGKAANSDHYWFSENGIPAFFMYTMGGIKAYHDIDDISSTLPLTKFEDCFRLIRDFIDEL